MINFMICENEPLIAQEYEKEIDSFMMGFDNEYKCHFFTGYGQKFKKKVKEEIGFKIYILDVKTQEGTGIDAARYIREECDDWVSMIIVITAYTEFKYDALGKRLLILDFISKMDKYKDRLRNDFQICLKNYDTKYKSLSYKYKGTLQTLELRNIICIEKEPDTRRCIITTTHGKFPIQGNLIDVEDKLDKRFLKTHRSLIVNIDHVYRFNSRTNLLEFKNKESTYLVARDKKKEVIKYARGLY